MKTKSEAIFIRVTSDEKKEIYKAARKQQFRNVSDWIRQKLFAIAKNINLP